MDNLMFIGYRIDVMKQEGNTNDIFDVCKWLAKENGQPVDTLPGEQWQMWESTDEEVDFSAMCIAIEEVPDGDYRCPIDRSELWEEMHGYQEHRQKPGVRGRTFDAPDTYAEDVAKIKETKIFELLAEQFDDVRVRWGIFLGLG